jgi:probable F420-dependent oxidoreductase
VKIDVDLVSVSRDVGDAVRIAERSGFDGAFLSEVTSDPLIAAGFAAAVSDRIELGTAITVAFARNPMSLALSAWDLQDMSGGRFLLGIGSQVRAHIERRYSMPWSDPAPRMREYIAAMREIWRCFREGSPLNFRGDYYQHTLLTDVFRPHRADVDPPPILLGAVGPGMTRAAIEAADGLLLHPLASAHYVEAVVAPEIRARRADSGSFVVRAMPYVATGHDEQSVADATARIRRLIAFHCSTPAYAPVLVHHGWQALHDELHDLSRAERWDDMAARIDDEVLHTFALVGDPVTVAREAARRYSGTCARVSLYTPDVLPEAVWATVAEELRAATQRETGVFSHG